MLNNHEIQRLKTIARPVEQIPAATTVARIIEQFQNTPSLLAIPVEVDGGFAGLISRKDLFSRHLSGQFSRDLYCRKPIITLIQPDPLVMPAEFNIHQGLEELLRRDPGLLSDCFGILEEGRCTGIVAVSDLMMTISRMQGTLLEKLEQLSSRIRGEVDRARHIQRGVLPETPCNICGLTVDAVMISSSEISGDYYDIFKTSDGRLGLLVADVTGHGIYAGFVTAAARAGLKVILENGAVCPGEMLKGMNRAIASAMPQEFMMSALVAVADRASGTIEFASAGHHYPWHFDASTGVWKEIITDSGFPLGFDINEDYPVTCSAFLAGDRILMYTDGVVEAESPDMALFGTTGMEKVLQAEISMPGQDLMYHIINESLAFTGRDCFSDDLTLLIAEPAKTA